MRSAPHIPPNRLPSLSLSRHLSRRPFSQRRLPALSIALCSSVSLAFAPSPRPEYLGMRSLALAGRSRSDAKHLIQAHLVSLNDISLHCHSYLIPSSIIPYGSPKSHQHTTPPPNGQCHPSSCPGRIVGIRTTGKVSPRSREESGWVRAATGRKTSTNNKSLETLICGRMYRLRQNRAYWAAGWTSTRASGSVISAGTFTMCTRTRSRLGAVYTRREGG